MKVPILALLLAATANPALEAAQAAPELEPVRVLEIVGGLPEDYDVSGVVEVGELLVIGVDEGSDLQVLERKKKDCSGSSKADRPYRLCQEVALSNDDSEIDVEALAAANGMVYALGSHSWKRKKVDGDKSRKENLERLLTVEEEPTRDRLFRIRLDPQTGLLDPDSVETRNLRENLQSDEYLRRFAAAAGSDSGLPSKENGVDFEGLAADGDTLYLGFRGPVLREGWVPVMLLDFDEAESHELRFVQLGGRGIRSLARVTDGFLVVAGPVGDSDLSYRLYRWDGRDCIPGKELAQPPCRLESLGTIPTWADAKAEGLAVLAEDASTYRILVAYDGVPKGLMTEFEVARPLP